VLQLHHNKNANALHALLLLISMHCCKHQHLLQLPSLTHSLTAPFTALHTQLQEQQQHQQNLHNHTCSSTLASCSNSSSSRCPGPVMPSAVPSLCCLGTASRSLDGMGPQAGRHCWLSSTHARWAAAPHRFETPRLQTIGCSKWGPAVMPCIVLCCAVNLLMCEHH
jgi:hypothetical protein